MPTAFWDLLQLSDRPHRVHWLGDLRQAGPGDITFDALLVPLAARALSPKYRVPASWGSSFQDALVLNDAARRALPIGLLPRIRIGTVLQPESLRPLWGRSAGTAIHRIGVCVGDWKHATRISTAQIAACSSSYLSVGRLVASALATMRAPLVMFKVLTYQGPASRDQSSANTELRTPQYILVHCLELLRFYIGLSSQLLRAVVDEGPLEFPGAEAATTADRWLNPTLSWLPENPAGHAELLLKPGRLWADAPALVRMVSPPGATGPTPGLHHAAIAFKSRHNRSTEGYWPLSYYPPFQGATTWEAYGTRIQLPLTTLLSTSPATKVVDGGPSARIPKEGANASLVSVLLVEQLRSCSAPFPFGSLTLRREGEIVQQVHHSPSDTSETPGDESLCTHMPPPSKRLAPDSIVRGTPSVTGGRFQERFAGTRFDSYPIEAITRVTAGEITVVTPARTGDHLIVSHHLGPAHRHGKGVRVESAHHEVSRPPDCPSADPRGFATDMRAVAAVLGSRVEFIGQCLTEQVGAEDEDGLPMQLTGIPLSTCLDTAERTDPLGRASISRWAFVGRRPRYLFVAQFAGVSDRAASMPIDIVDIERDPSRGMTERYAYLAVRRATGELLPADYRLIDRVCVQHKGVWHHGSSALSDVGLLHVRIRHVYDSDVSRYTSSRQVSAAEPIERRAARLARAVRTLDGMTGQRR